MYKPLPIGKIVRGRILEIIFKQQGIKLTYIILTSLCPDIQERVTAKLREELLELQDAKSQEEKEEEAGDLLDVLDGILKNRITMSDQAWIESLYHMAGAYYPNEFGEAHERRLRKIKEKGDFSQLILVTGVKE